MENDQVKTIAVTVVSVIIANWAMVAPMLKFIVKNAWEKSIEWRDMVNDIKIMKQEIDEIKKDVTAAHYKLREMHNGENNTRS